MSFFVRRSCPVRNTVSETTERCLEPSRYIPFLTLGRERLNEYPLQEATIVCVLADRRHTIAEPLEAR